MLSECINFKAYGKVIEAFMARYAEVLKACRDRKLLWSSFQYLRALLLFFGLDIFKSVSKFISKVNINGRLLAEKVYAKFLDKNYAKLIRKDP